MDRFSLSENGRGKDRLTGLLGRYECGLEVEGLLGAVKEGGKGGFLLLADIDDFKVINGSLGYEYGDAVLTGFAGFLEELVGQDRAFRFGGDEFVALLDEENLDSVLESLQGRSLSPWVALDREVFFSASAGVVELDGKAGGADVLRNAELAMYEAKRRGKNRVQFFAEGLDESFVSRAQMEFMLRRSMDNGFEGFRVLYQPIVEVATGRVCGAEALLRMDYDGRMVRPRDFLPLANYLGFIVPIGEFVIKEAAKVCRRICDSGLPDFVMTVNISARQMAQEGINGRIEDVLDKAGVDYRNFAVAVDESDAMEDPGRMMKVCSALRSRGIQVVLDEFGGGNASFVYLRDMPVDVIKIARVFVQNQGDQYSREFMDLMIKLGHSIGKEVCISGIETRDQLAFSEVSGADQLQGFYLYTADDASILRDILCFEMSASRGVSSYSANVTFA